MLCAQDCPINVAGVPDFYTFTLSEPDSYTANQCLTDYGAIIRIDGALYHQTSCFNPGDGWVAVYSKTAVNSASLPFSVDFFFGTCMYDAGGILPVELARFSGAFESTKVVLNWTTWSEWNNRGFEIQRVTEALGGEPVYSGWTTIGFVEGAGYSSITTDYSFIDLSPPVGQSYYRLKQMDFDDAFSYSGIIAVDHSVAGENHSFRAYPNPAASSVRLSSKETTIPEDTPFSIYDVTGRKVGQGRLSNTGEIDLHRLSPGVYQLRLELDRRDQFIRIVKK